MQRVRLPQKLLRNAAVKTLIQLAVERGVHVYLVGGAVRDLILGKSLTDIDVVVTGIPYKQLGNFLNKHGSANAAGDFGTIKFLAEGEHRPIDIALPRTEQSDASGARTGFAVRFDETLPIEEDLGRRDFTINAMAIDMVTKRLIDVFDSQKDIAERIIRTVGDPMQRFTEDYTRLLRAFRFACELDADIEHQTRKALKTLALKITEGMVPEEMIASELSKALVGNPTKFMELLEPTGIGRVLLPDLMALRNLHESYGDDVFMHTQKALAASRSKTYAALFGAEEKDPSILFALLLHDLGKAKTRSRRKVRGVMVTSFNRHAERSADLAHVVWERLKLSQSGANRTVALSAIANHMLLERADITNMRNQTLDQYFLNKQAEGTALKKLIWCDWEGGDDTQRTRHHTAWRHLEKRLKDIEQRAYRNGKPVTLLSGHEIMREYHIPQGEELGKILLSLRSLLVEDKLHTPEEARAYLNKQHGNAART